MSTRRRIAVVGSNSFSGSDFIDLLLEDERNEVLGISRSAQKSALYLPYLRHRSQRFAFLQADLNHESAALLARLDEFEPEYVVNFAGQIEVASSWQHPDHYFETNAVAVARLVHHLKDRPYLRKYVHLSTPEVYGACDGRVREDAALNPSTPYAASKAAADLLLAAYRKNYEFPVVSVRSTNVYGAHQQLFRIIPRAIIKIKTGGVIDLHGGGVAVKSFIHIRDVSRGELAILEAGRPGEIYHLSPDESHTVRQIVSMVARRLGADPAAVMRSVAERLGQDAAYVIDSSKARETFEWRPQIGLEQGIADVVAWIERSWNEVLQEPLEYLHSA